MLLCVMNMLSGVICCERMLYVTSLALATLQ